MKTDLYNRLMVDTLNNIPNNLKQKVINKVIDKGIGTYNKKEGDNKIDLKKLSLDERILKCIQEYKNIFKIYDEVELEKGYRYSFMYKYNNINLDKLNNLAYNLKELDYEEIFELEEFNIQKPYYLEDEECIYIKFHKSINEVEIKVKEDGLNKYDRRYPVIVVIHKKYNTLDIRFDKVTHKKDENFYKKSLEIIVPWIKNRLECDLTVFELSKSLLYIVNNCSNQVAEDICSMGFEKDKGVVLNYGESKVMPLIGELEELIKENIDIFNKTEDTKSCKDILEKYIFVKKVLSSKHYRVLRWLNEENNLTECVKGDVRAKFIFNYKGIYEDLVHFIDSKNNNMETMNYVIRYIKKAESNC